jgi:hypothetical protein
MNAFIQDKVFQYPSSFKAQLSKYLILFDKYLLKTLENYVIYRKMTL